MQFHQTKLDNGLQVIAEVNPHAQSVAAGFFVRTGSRDETDDVAGVSHFLEHMAFKGNDTYTADDVNRIFDEIGASYNASTSEELTLFYAAILPEYFPKAFEMLACLIQPTLRQDDFEMEKKVILEEIGMYDDQPGFLAYEKGMSKHFEGHPLGRSILGSNESITALSAEQMQQYHNEHYKSGNIILAVTGNIGWQEIVDLANQYCGEWTGGSFERSIEEANPNNSTSVITREQSVQQHVMQMAKAPHSNHSLRYPAELLTLIIGDDSGSRLFWEIVDPGYAEAAEVGYNEYDGSGTYLTYLSCAPEETTANLQRVQKIYDAVNQDGVTEQELEEAKNKVASRIVLRSERPMGRLSSLGNNWLYRKEYRSVEDDLQTVQSISKKDISELLALYPLAQTTTIGVGPLEAIETV
ncbi:FIG007959: peptidase, M16 family [hydrothermal vent metagenome]|uniref:FIG007959: peptidase, M16 family n=1 Tax=hydrothermal vent metagenome TaxID=652676 RepID=A0A3B1DWD0_9ZZZZ